MFNFEPFRNDLRLTLGDLRLAREASAPPKPEEQKPVEPEKVAEKRIEEPRRDSKVHQRASERPRIEPRRVVEMEQVPAGARRR